MTFKTANIVCVAVGKNGEAQGDRLIRMGIDASPLNNKRKDLRFAIEALCVALSHLCEESHVVINIGVEMTFLDQP